MTRVVVLVLVVACGSSTNPNGGDDAPDAAVDGSGSGSGSTMLYPLAVGDTWTFGVIAVGAGSICAAGSHMQAVQSANAIGGRAAFQMTSFCTGITGTNNYATGPGDEIDFYYNTSWLMLVDPTLAEGTSWPYFNSTYHWHRAGTVTVPAGTYSDCWTAVQDVSYTAYLTYCRGAGLVRSYSQDLAGNGWDAQLSAIHL
jgi:hypothetical protein